MSKIICDVCGTTYPETAAQCPICGCAKSADSRTVTGDKVNAAGEAASAYQFVKGGRFSKRNVHKRNKDTLKRQEPKLDPQEDQQEGNNNGFVILLLLLLGAIIAVVLYIAIRFFVPADTDPTTKPTENTKPSHSASATTDPTTLPTTAPTTEPTDAPTTMPTTEPATEPTTEPSTEPTYPCTGLTIHNTKIQLGAVGAEEKISVDVKPANTTDVLVFVSDNVNVVTVSSDGTVTAVGEGTAKITVTCGIFEVSCNVEVVLPTTEPTEPPTEPTEPPTEPKSQLELNRSDFSLFGPGGAWNVYSGSLPLHQVSWSSSAQTVVTVENGVVTAVGPGVAYVYANWNGEEARCIVYCQWEPSENDPTVAPTEPTEEPTEEPTIPDGEGGDAGLYVLLINGDLPGPWGNDVTLRIGESVDLTVVNPHGDPVAVTWIPDAEGYVSVSGNRITGEYPIRNLVVSAVYDGHTFTCTIRVSS